MSTARKRRGRGPVIESRTSPTRLRHRRATVVAVIAGAILLLLIGAGVLGVTVLPSALLTFGARVADSDTRVTVGDQDAPVTVAVPAGWVMKWPPLQGNTVVLTTPDAALSITITATGSASAQAFAEASQDSGSVGAPVIEALGSGLSVMHARSGDGALIAAVGMPDGERSATVVARVAGANFEDYLPAVGQIIDGLHVSS